MDFDPDHPRYEVPDTLPGPSQFTEADPLSPYLDAALLPAMEFVNAPIDEVIETLRNLAARTLARARIVPHGVSIALLATPVQRARPVNLTITEGMSFVDALAELALATDLCLTWGTVGFVLCPWEVGLQFEECLKESATPDESAHITVLDRGQRLRLISLYPPLGVANNPLRRAWLDAWRASDRTAAPAYRLAHEIIGKAEDDGCLCVAQVPVNLPAVTDNGQIPGLPDAPES